MPRGDRSSKLNRKSEDVQCPLTGPRSGRSMIRPETRSEIEVPQQARLEMEFEQVAICHRQFEPQEGIWTINPFKGHLLFRF